MYITLAQYCTLYDEIDEKQFNRLSFDAGRLMDYHTTGVDGFKKLKAAFPGDEDSVAAVMHCAGNIINLLAQIEEAEKNASVGRGYTETENGLQRKIVSRVESGNEAISFMESQTAGTTIDKAISDKSARDALIRDTIREYLSGITDSNGVNLLYMGTYPRRLV